MSFPYTIEQLSNMNIGALKDIARKYNIGGFSKYKAANKQELANLIWMEKHPKTKVPAPTKMPAPKVPAPTKVHKKPTILDPPKATESLKRLADKYKRIDANVPPIEPRKATKNQAQYKILDDAIEKQKRGNMPIINPKKVSKINYDFNEEKVMDINISINSYDPTKKPIPSSDDITPDILLKLIGTDEFCKKVATSLRNIYSIKHDKYDKLSAKLSESIRKDKEEKDKLRVDINPQDLDKMFPMIPVHKAFLIKVQTKKIMAQKKYHELSSMDNAVIQNIRARLTNAVTNEEDGITSITGERRAPIRNQLCRQLFILSKGHRPFMDAFLNMVFTGPAGVGKTKLAKAVGYVYEQSGILLDGEVIVVSPKDLVGEHIGSTAPKTAGVLMKGLENIIFIDEAYQIMPCADGKIIEGRSFGPEAITEIVNFLDKYVGLSIMIVAGYQREIDGCFFAANEGLRRRFPVQIRLPPYMMVDLLNIFLNEATKRLGENVFTQEIALYIYTIMVRLDKFDSKIFINQAGDIMNLVSMFLTAYYGSYKIQWGSYKNDILIVNSMFNQYLRNKGYTMTIR